MRVRARYDETVKTFGCHLLAQCGKAGRALFGAGGFGKVLEHAWLFFKVAGSKPESRSDATPAITDACLRRGPGFFFFQICKMRGPQGRACRTGAAGSKPLISARA
jgi:hypothetical protein